MGDKEQGLGMCMSVGCQGIGGKEELIGEEVMMASKAETSLLNVTLLMAPVTGPVPHHLHLSHLETKTNTFL